MDEIDFYLIDLSSKFKKINPNVQIQLTIDDYISKKTG